MWIRRRSELAIAAALLLACVDAKAAPPAPAPSHAPSSAAPAQDEALSQYRERFKLGMDRYHAGAFAEAIGYWEPIYRELGAQKGYRLAYDLGVAYSELGDATRAAERLQAFLGEVDARRARGETIAPMVQKEEADARARLDALTASKGRIRVDAGEPPRAVQVDANEPRLAGFVAWVAPGSHTVTFAPGTPEAETKTVDVGAGALVEIAPTAAPAPAPAPATAPATATASASAPAPATAPSAYVPRETHHPFSPLLFGLTGTLAVAAGVAAVPLEMHAWTLHDQYVAEQRSSLTIPSADRQSFENARTWAYVTVGAAVGLGAVTAALAAWYFLGTSSREVMVTPAGVAGRF